MTVQELIDVLQSHCPSDGIYLPQDRNDWTGRTDVYVSTYVTKVAVERRGYQTTILQLGEDSDEHVDDPALGKTLLVIR